VYYSQTDTHECLPVGANNHRQFILFITNLVIGIILFDYLTFACTCTFHIDYAAFTHALTPSDFAAADASIDHTNISPSCILPTDLCALTAYDTFLFSVAAWATLQLSWTIVLLASQFWQITRQMTTLEVSNLGRYGFMGGRGGQSMSGQMGHRHAAAQQAQGGMDELGASGGDHAHAHGAHGHSHNPCGGPCGAFLLSILGFDRFTRGKASQGLARASTAHNPFDTGILGNCRDFWSKGSELGVDYERLYDVPLEGFREAKRRREREDVDDAGGAAARRGRKGLFMGLAGLGRSSRAGYEPVSQV
jgi:palmitoyltransferase ZDHHC13/17